MLIFYGENPVFVFIQIRKMYHFLMQLYHFSQRIFSQCCDEVDPVAKVNFIFIETLSVEADVDDY